MTGSGRRDRVRSGRCGGVLPWLAVGFMLALPGCPETDSADVPEDNTSERSKATAGSGTPSAPGAVAKLWFVNEAAERGLTAINHCGHPTDKRYALEEIGNGCALFDYDGDGDLDAWIADSCTLNPPAEPGQDWRPAMDGKTILYENDGDGRFTAVSGARGVEFHGFGSGVSVADYDNDGDPDVYMTCWGRNLLWQNDGAGNFAEVGRAAGVDDPGWGVGSCWFDAEGDGDLDLYVANYFIMDVARDPDCWNRVDCDFRGMIVACGPRGMVAEQDRFYINRGDGTFVEEAGPRGLLEVEPRYGLGTIAFDYEGDGDQDLYVANDSLENCLYENDGTGHFTEMGALLGTSLSRDGVAQAGMGIACGDYDGDQDSDLFLTNFSHDYHTLYRNDGFSFLDVSQRVGLAEDTFFLLGWGCEFVDFDNDADLDLVVANGHVYPEADERRPEQSYRQQNLLYRNDSSGLVNVTAAAGPGLEREASSRGLAVGDVDGDGDQDVLIVAQNEAPTLLINHTRGAGNSLLLELRGKTQRDAIGARITLFTADTAQQFEIRSGHSFASCHDRRAHFGIGQHERVERIEIRWPDGTLQTLTDVAANQVLVIEQE